MIDTFACCGKSIGEKILLPNLFKQAMVKFSFSVTNLTSQESDSSLAARWAEKHSFLEAPKSQIHFGISLDVLWPPRCPHQVAAGAEVGGARQEHGGKSRHVIPWLAQQGDKWSLSDTFGETATDSCTAWLNAQAHCIFFYWFDLTFYDKLALETIHLLTPWKMTVLGGGKWEEKREREIESDWKCMPMHL